MHVENHTKFTNDKLVESSFLDSILIPDLPSVSDWSRQHPENWDSSSVEEWMKFVAEKYQFPDNIRRKCIARLRGVTGKCLLAMELPNFQHWFKEIGELVYLAFLQIMDTGPKFEGRGKFYTDKINAILEVLVRSDEGCEVDKSDDKPTETRPVDSPETTD